MIYVLYTIHIGISLFLILVVLLQQGKGADLSVFGGGGTQAAFGARGAATLLHKLTVFAFVAFILTTILIGFSTGGGSSSVMSSVGSEEAAVEESAAFPVDPSVDDSVPADPMVGSSAAGEATDGLGGASSNAGSVIDPEQSAPPESSDFEDS